MHNNFLDIPLLKFIQYDAISLKYSYIMQMLTHPLIGMQCVIWLLKVTRD